MISEHIWNKIPTHSLFPDDAIQTRLLWFVNI